MCLTNNSSGRNSPGVRKNLSIPILVYHKIGIPTLDEFHPNSYVSPARFSFQIEWLAKQGYQTIGPQDLLDVRRGASHNLPGKPLLITFDDASETVYLEALPVLRKYGFSALVFMVADAFGKPAFWDGETKEQPHRLLTSNQLKNLLRHGWFVGSHSLTHSRLTKCDPDILAREAQKSKIIIENELGQPVDWFAYPFGDFDDNSQKAIREAGYKLAFATEQGDGSDFALPRRTISGRVHWLRFLWRLHQAKKMRTV